MAEHAEHKCDECDDRGYVLYESREDPSVDYAFPCPVCRLRHPGDLNPWALVLDWFFIADEARRRLAALDQVREDARMVLTVYDDRTEPENRGPWRDRLMAWATPEVEDVELPAVPPVEETTR